MHDAYRVDKGGAPTFDRVMRGLATLQAARRRVQHAHHAPPRERRPPGRGLPVPPRRVRRRGSCSSSRSSSGCRRRRSTCRSTSSAWRRAGPRGAVALVARPPALPPGGQLVTDRSVTAEQYGALPRRGLRGVGPPRHRRGLRPDVRRRARQLARRAADAVHLLRDVRRRRSPWSTTATSTRATTSSRRATSSATSRRRRWSSWWRREQQRQFGQDKRDTLPRYCRECDVRFACHGGCPKDRFIRTPDGEPGLNYLCAGYKAFFRHVDAPMRMMSGLLRPGPRAVRAHGLVRGRGRAPRAPPSPRPAATTRARAAAGGSSSTATAGPGRDTEAGSIGAGCEPYAEALIGDQASGRGSPWPSRSRASSTSTSGTPRPDWEPYRQPMAPEGAPNVLYVVLDDVGFSAMEPFGGLIETPNINRIADARPDATRTSTRRRCARRRGRA